MTGTKLRLADSSAFPVDEAWEDTQGIWYRKQGVTQLLDRAKVRAIERVNTSPRADEANRPAGEGNAMPAEPQSSSESGPIPKAFSLAAETVQRSQPVWLYLVGGGRVEADDAGESPAGIWYRRGALSVFMERSRVERIEREDKTASEAASRTARGWSTGNPQLDSLIKQSGTRHGVDPYLVFLVMQEESHFNSHAVSPKGARGLMQLMPGTSARFGVRHPFAAPENIDGGTRYLKQLLQRYNGRVDLALAGYNAGEARVAEFGQRVPPYRETQGYVRRISKRYGRARVAESKGQPGRHQGG